MKRIKSMGLNVCAILIAAVIFFGTSGLCTFVSAASLRAVVTPSVIAEGTIVREVELGEYFKVPNGVIEVKAPNGQPVTPNNDGVFANQLGNYTVEISSGAATTYSYNVYCSQTRDYSVYVEYDGAKIPTFMATNGTFEVPDVFLGYTDDDGEIQEYEPATEADINGFTISTSGVPAQLTQDATTKAWTVKPTERGTLILRYSISISEGKFYSKEYSITVQDDFKNDTNARISVVNVPLTANLNTKVTLPIASATSSFDDRVFVEVIVTHQNLVTDENPTGRVVVMQEDEIDSDTGYATPIDNDTRSYKDNDLVKFDNVRTMSFYATERGEYKVTYQAKATSGKPSTLHDYYIQCDDGLAPVFVDFDRHDIPTKWGQNVTKSAKLADGTAVDPSVDPAINLPIPDVKDNADGFTDLTVSLRITDPIGRTVLRFANILNALEPDAGEGNNGHIAAENSRYANGAAADRTFTATGFKFDFNKYNVDLSEKIGSYTFEYRVVDSKGRGRTYSPSIALSLTNSFEDVNAPQISPIDTVKYILLGKGGDESLVIPKAEVSDDNDSNPHIQYFISYLSDPTDSTTAVEEILDEAKTLDIIEENGNYFLVDDKDFRLQIGDSLLADGGLTLRVVATDDVGNVSESDEVSIAIYHLSNKSQTLTLSSGLADGTSISRLDASGNKYADSVELGFFRILGATDARFAGFEVVIKDENGTIIPVTLERMVTSDVIYVNNVTFVPKISGNHDLYVRVFDVKGESKLYVFSFEITGDIDDGIPFDSVAARNAAMPATGGSVNTKYALKGNPGETTNNLSVVKVTGNSFSLIGNDFIANATGGYLIEEYYISKSNVDLNTNLDDHSYDSADLIKHRTYNTAIGDTNSPVIEILGTMPAHQAKSDIDTTKRFDFFYDDDSDEYFGLSSENFIDLGWVLLPSVAAYNNRTNVDVKIKVTDRNDTEVTAYKVYQNGTGAGALYGIFREADVPSGYYFANMWAFAPLTDGAHKVVYTAQLNASTPTTSEHTILIGKISGPSFVLNSSTRNAFTIGAEFKFFTIGTVTDVDAYGDEISIDKINAYTYVKKLIDPSGATVVEVRGNDRAKISEAQNNGTAIKLEMSGTYTEIYEVTDSFGNKTTMKETFQVNAKSRGTTSSMKMLSTILIIVAVLLLAGAIFYVVRIRKVKRIER